MSVNSFHSSLPCSWLRRSFFIVSAQALYPFNCASAKDVGCTYSVPVNCVIKEEASAFYDKRKISFEDFKILDNEYVPLPTILKRKGTEKVDIKAVAVTKHNTQNFYGLQFNWKDQSII